MLLGLFCFGLFFDMLVLSRFLRSWRRISMPTDTREIPTYTIPARRRTNPDMRLKQWARPRITLLSATRHLTPSNGGPKTIIYGPPPRGTRLSRASSSRGLIRTRTWLPNPASVDTLGNMSSRDSLYSLSQSASATGTVGSMEDSLAGLQTPVIYTSDSMFFESSTLAPQIYNRPTDGAGEDSPNSQGFYSTPLLEFDNTTVDYFNLPKTSVLQITSSDSNEPGTPGISQAISGEIQSGESFSSTKLPLEAESPFTDNHSFVSGSFPFDQARLEISGSLCGEIASSSSQSDCGSSRSRPSSPLHARQKMDSPRSPSLGKSGFGQAGQAASELVVVPAHGTKDLISGAIYNSRPQSNPRANPHGYTTRRISVTSRLKALVDSGTSASAAPASGQARRSIASPRYPALVSSSWAPQPRTHSQLPQMRRDFQERATASGISVSRGDSVPTSRLRHEKKAHSTMETRRA
ncbi:hypothetical protein HGRIS_004021 [Hohenbuehelia grisea]|uniref:Uncharacterized protein n=1 Tax=Hohenbuehelia grisea TaxID=104357 RepID=A0ABR3JIY8_9AGAR